MYSMDSLEYAVKDLFRGGVENSDYTADEVEDLLGGIDYHALLQTIRHNAHTVHAYATQGHYGRNKNGVPILRPTGDAVGRQYLYPRPLLQIRLRIIEFFSRQGFRLSVL